MSKVSLRIYNRDIESLIDQGQLDEAIAHCRHILNTFPKHLETYRLLGKAYLEAKRYPEATEIFQRLLMAVPDDFVAHVGMSIISDEQNNMDDAIWHMERAFEGQPSNSAIQAELQRLFGRRDGVEPPKIRLTRGALAHMYVQGELYTQAISEINKVLEDDPNRQDMQVLLARAYFHAGQKTESAEICDHLLRRYPYCLDANRVLVELLPETDGGENVHTYRQRVNELDPYTAFARESIFRAEDAPDASVNIERLDWNGQPVTMDTNWGSSMGVGLSSVGEAGEQEPAWLRAGLTDASSMAPFVDEQAPVAAPSDEEKLELLQETGGDRVFGASLQEGGASELPSQSDLAEGDLPAWVRAMAPEESGLSSMETSQEENSTIMPGDDIPDWLQEIKQDELAGSEQPFEQTNLGDLLSKDGPTLAEETDLDRLDVQPDATGETPEETAEQPQEVGETHDLPDFLKQDSQPISESDAEANALEAGVLGVSAAEQDDALAWLEGLAAKHGAKPEELLTKPEERLETEPEWVRQAKSLETGGQIPDETPDQLSELIAEEPVLEDLPDFLKQTSQPVNQTEPDIQPDDIGGLDASSPQQDDSSVWLEGFKDVRDARIEESVPELGTDLESQPMEMPPAGDIGVSGSLEESPAMVDETGLWMEGLNEDNPQVQPDQLPDIPDWLQGADSKDGGSESESPMESGVEAEQEPGQSDSAPGLPTEDMQPPDWLRSLEAETTTPPGDEKSIDDLPAWLAGLDEEKNVEPASSSDSFPEWLQPESEGEPVSLEPVSPKDWIPAEAEPEASLVSLPDEEKVGKLPSREPPAKAHTGSTGNLSTTSDPMLAQAQGELSRGNIPGALEIYSKLIKKGRLLDEVVFDLREALYRYPVEIVIWQSLGDAYLRANRLQDALDAYTKAEELLR